jgi:nucleoside-diphosphate-sugar epimerase
MRVFVVGSTGVLGHVLMPLLLQQGYIVRSIARTSEKV